ncbi:hypothetical protein [Sanguibacter sp. HDW7]|nr:hypothetical protein [Sanguibacter sp. HDW7]QIK83013.1 hypothetical protein G7063_04760 [Sanguibacter sp. HDW7]
MSDVDPIIAWASDGDRHTLDVTLVDLLGEVPREAVMVHPDGTVSLA